MPNPKADLLLHPVRIRIVTELMTHPQTTGQLANRLSDVAQATLYRHIKLLQNGEIIEVAKETPVNGAIERTYSLVEGASRLSADELQDVTQEEHLLYFNTFVASLMETFGRYIQQANPAEVVDDGMSYNRAVVHLSDAEREAFHEEMITLVSKYLPNTPAPDRKRFTLASIVIPEESDK